MAQALPFSPLGASVVVAAGLNASSGSTTLPGAGGTSVKIVNVNTTPVSVAFSQTPGGAVATATGLIINTGITEIHGLPIGTTDVAAWGLGAAGNVYFQRGEGI